MPFRFDSLNCTTSPYAIGEGISEHSAADCGIIQNMNKARQIAPIVAAVISGGIMACAEAAQNAAVHVPSKVDVCDASGIGESRK